MRICSIIQGEVFDTGPIAPDAHGEMVIFYKFGVD